MNLDKLINQINIFYKYAGLLKVPEKAIKEAEEFIIPKYYQYVSDNLLEIIKKQSYHLKLNPEIAAYAKTWNAIFALMLNIAYKEQDFERDLEKLLRITSQSIGLPSMENYWDTSKDSAYIFINKKDNTYSVHFKSDFYYEGKSYNTSINKSNLSLEELITIFQQIIPDVQDLADKITDFYNLNQNSKDYKLKELKVNQAIYKQKAKNAKSQKSITINVTDSDIPELTKLQNQYRSFNFDIFFIHDKSEMPKNTAGIYQLKKYQDKSIGNIYILCPEISDFESSEQIHEKYLDLKSVIRHEIQHFVQYFIKKIHFLKQEGGLPSAKLKNPNVNTYGIPINPVKSELIDQDDSHKRVLHPLRDIEFYSELSDSIEYFNRYKNKLPLYLHHLYAKRYVDNIDENSYLEQAENILNQKYSSDEKVQSILNDVLNHSKIDNFFTTLKKYQPMKYKKAVTEFMKAIF